MSGIKWLALNTTYNLESAWKPLSLFQTSFLEYNHVHSLFIHILDFCLYYILLCSFGSSVDFFLSRYGSSSISHSYTYLAFLWLSIPLFMLLCYVFLFVSSIELLPLAFFWLLLFWASIELFWWFPMSFQWLPILVYSSKILPYWHQWKSRSTISPFIIDGNILPLSPFDINGKWMHTNSPYQTAPPVLLHLYE